MMMEVLPTLAVQLLVFSSLVVAATAFNNDRFQTESNPPEITDGYDEEEEVIPVIANTNKPLSLGDVLNQRVNSKAELCPTFNVMLFFKTGNLEFLRDCYARARTGANQKRPDAQAGMTSSSSAQAQSPRAPVMASYSGRLLKRILQNMGDGPAKIDIVGSSGDSQKRVSDKRAPLSINGALSSLVDMLRYENGARDNGGPKYAFHTDLLHMG